MMENVKSFVDFLQESIDENEKPKVGDKLTMVKNGKVGEVVKCMSDMCNVDFGGGDVYGIVYRRIKGDKIYEEHDQLDEAMVQEAGKIKPSSAKALATAIITHLSIEGYFYVPHDPTRESVINRLADFIAKSTF